MEFQGGRNTECGSTIPKAPTSNGRTTLIPGLEQRRHPLTLSKRLGIIGRADCGGLGTQSFEAIRHLNPDKVLILDMGMRGRGSMVYQISGSTVLSLRQFTPRAMQQFLQGLDVVLGFETVYSAELCLMAKSQGIRVVIQVNPELYRPHEYPYADVILPTTWERDRIPHAPILPVPINRSVLPFRQRTEARVFYHPIAPAMLDRSGTDLVIDALPYIREKVEIIFRGTVPRGLSAPSNVKVWILPNENRPYYDLYPSHADVLLQPRRYGGLNLPMQEAASLGMPVLGIGIPPMSELPHAFNVPPIRATMQSMKGGVFPVYTTLPQSIASRIDWLAQNPTEVAQASLRANEWAETLNWSHWASRYREFLGVDSADPSHIRTPNASPTP